jgi:hypothetical protein
MAPSPPADSGKLVRDVPPADTATHRRTGPARSPRWFAILAVAGIAISAIILIVVGFLGPSITEPAIPSASPWPPFFATANPSVALISYADWVAVLVGVAGVASGVVAVGRGWRPRPQLLLAASLIGVVLLMLSPPIGSSDAKDDAVYGRIAALGHNPYVMTPLQLKQTGDPVAQFAARHWQRDTSPYGPLATVTQLAASKLGGASVSRTMFWIKVWNALAFLAIALALDWFFRRDAAGRARAHLLWSVNPLMLLASMSGGHNDVLGAVFGVLAVLALRRLDFRVGLLAGVLAGLAVDVKATYALFGLGLIIAAIRSPRTLSGLGLGALVVMVPCYALAGKQSVTSVIAESDRAVNTYQPWQLLAHVASSFQNQHRMDAAAVVASVITAGLLLWKMPAGPARLPAVRPVLALTLAWLIWSPQQRAWYDVLIFPLLALMPMTRLDWIALARGAAGAIGQLPANTIAPKAPPPWLSHLERVLELSVVPCVLVALALVLLVLCLSGHIQSRRRGPWRGDMSARPGPLPAAAPG